MINFIKYNLLGIFFKDNPTITDSFIFFIEFIIILIIITNIINIILKKSDDKFKNYYGVFK